MRALRIGTRGSPLALWQARAVAAALSEAGVETELVTITTGGDRQQDAPLAAIGGKGVFVKEIHEALLARTIDLAVHSAKDMPAVSPAGLTIGAVLPREDPRDALVFPHRPHDGLSTSHPPHPVAHPPDDALSTSHPPHPLPHPLALIGSGSPRRVAQFRRMFPGARFEPIRGNVDTRLRKLDGGNVDALILACAGLRRLGLADRITAAVAVTDCVPAPGQGIIAIEARAADGEILELLARVNDAPARAALAAEQAVVEELGGGCQLPLGAFAEIQSGELLVRAIAASPDGTEIIEAAITGGPGDPAGAGTRLGRELASRGARELLNS